MDNTYGNRQDVSIASWITWGELWYGQVTLQDLLSSKDIFYV